MRAKSAVALVVFSLFPLLSWAGSIAGKVEATPAKYLSDTVVYVTEAKATPAPKSHSMDQKGMKFLPHLLDITAGDSVEFLNHDGVDHNVFTPDGETYNLGMIKPNAKGSFTFKKPGAYSQLCSIHPEMLGYIYASPTPYHATVDASGAYKIDHVPPGSYTVAIWNAKLKAASVTVTVAEGKPAQADFQLKR